MDILDRQEDERWSQSKRSLKHRWRQTRQNCSCPSRARHEKAGLFGKDDTAEKNRRQREKRKPNTGWMDSTEDALGASLRELSRAAEDRTVWTSLTHRVARSQR